MVDKEFQWKLSLLLSVNPIQRIPGNVLVKTTSVPTTKLITNLALSKWGGGGGVSRCGRLSGYPLNFFAQLTLLVGCLQSVRIPLPRYRTVCFSATVRRN